MLKEGGGRVGGLLASSWDAEQLVRTWFLKGLPEADSTFFNYFIILLLFCPLLL